MESYLGEIRLFAGSYAPQNWNFCDGTLLSISQYDALYSLIGTTFGGDGTKNFALPDLRGRVPVGQGADPDLTARTIGQKGGSETVALTTDSLPTHQHLILATNNAASTKDPSPSVGFSQITDGAWFYAKASAQPKPLVMNPNVISSTGGGAVHNNVMPAMALNYIICLNGIFPERPS